MANASFLQAILVCVPIIFLTRDNPQAFFIVLSVVLFIVPGAILFFIFVPKMLSMKEQSQNKDRKSNVRVSGLIDPSTLRASIISGANTPNGSFRTNFGSFRSGAGSFRNQSFRSTSIGDPVKDLLQQFQRLTWEDKTAVLNQLAPPGGASQTAPNSTSGSLNRSGSLSSKGSGAQKQQAATKDGSNDAMDSTESTDVDGMDPIQEVRESVLEEPSVLSFDHPVDSAPDAGLGSAEHPLVLGPAVQEPDLENAKHKDGTVADEA